MRQISSLPLLVRLTAKTARGEPHSQRVTRNSEVDLQALLLIW